MDVCVGKQLHVTQIYCFKGWFLSVVAGFDTTLRELEEFYDIERDKGQERALSLFKFWLRMALLTGRLPAFWRPFYGRLTSTGA
jgi:hypothetical protein